MAFGQKVTGVGLANAFYNYYAKIEATSSEVIPWPLMQKSERGVTILIYV